MGQTKSICVFKIFVQIFSPENHPIVFLLRTINSDEVDQARFALMKKQKLKKRKSRKRLQKQNKKRKLA